MSIRITPKTDYSSLFNNTSNDANQITSALSSEYSSIKNGSYGKLLKAYYSKTPNAKSSEWVKKNANVKDTKNLSEVKASSVDLKQSVSVINNKLIDSGDKDKLKTSVKEFADSYNSLIKSAENSSNSSIIKQAKSLTNNTYVNADVLKGVGITINSDNTLSVDEKKLTTASDSALKSVFTNNGSFGDTTSSKASLLYNSANSALTSGGFYDRSANSSNNNLLGGLFETYN